MKMIGRLVNFRGTTKLGIILAVTQKAWSAVRYKVLCSNGKVYHTRDNQLEVLNEKKEENTTD